MIGATIKRGKRDNINGKTINDGGAGKYKTAFPREEGVYREGATQSPKIYNIFFSDISL